MWLYIGRKLALTTSASFICLSSSIFMPQCSKLRGGKTNANWNQYEKSRQIIGFSLWTYSTRRVGQPTGVEREPCLLHHWQVADRVSSAIGGHTPTADCRGSIHPSDRTHATAAPITWWCLQFIANTALFVILLSTFIFPDVSSVSRAPPSSGAAHRAR